MVSLWASLLFFLSISLHCFVAFCLLLGLLNIGPMTKLNLNSRFIRSPSKARIVKEWIAADSRHLSKTISCQHKAEFYFLHVPIISQYHYREVGVRTTHDKKLSIGPTHHISHTKIHPVSFFTTLATYTAPKPNHRLTTQSKRRINHAHQINYTIELSFLQTTTRNSSILIGNELCRW